MSICLTELFSLLILQNRSNEIGNKKIIKAEQANPSGTKQEQTDPMYIKQEQRMWSQRDSLLHRSFRYFTTEGYGQLVSICICKY